MVDDVALLVVDMQREYFEPERPLSVADGESVLESVARLLDAARETDTHVVHVRHVSSDPDDDTFAVGSRYTRIVDEIDVRGREPVVTKTNPGAFHGTRLDDVLDRRGVGTVAIAGLLSFLCVDTTAREADARDYHPLYVRDATSAVDLGDVPAERIDEVVEAVQGTLFSEVVTTDEVVERMHQR